MYGIFTYIYNTFKPNVGKYSIHESYGYWFHPTLFPPSQVLYLPFLLLATPAFEKKKTSTFFQKPIFDEPQHSTKKRHRDFRDSPPKMEPTLGHGGGLCQHDWTSTNFLEAAPDSLPALPALPAAVETPQKAVRVGSWVFFRKIRSIPKNGALVQMIFGWFLVSSR